MEWQPDRASPDLSNLPKCNLHSHLEGSLRPETFWELAHEQGIDLEVSHEGARSLLQVDGSESSLVDYLAKISAGYPVLRTHGALRRAAFEAAEDAAADGVVYFELRAGPMTHVHKAMNVDQAIEAILKGLRDAERALPITCRFIAAALRHHDPADNVLLAEAAVAHRGEGVVGFDLAGDEAGFPASLHAEAFRIARDGGLGITVHAGEAGGAENVRYAVEQLSASRIGHGVRSIESPQVMDLLGERGVTLEVCPTSNVHTRAVNSLAGHPVRRLFDAGIGITIGDDDPVTSNTSVAKELTILQRDFGFQAEELIEIQQAGLKAAFGLDPREREDILDLIHAASEQWSPSTGAERSENDVI